VRGVHCDFGPSRIKGRQSLLRRLRALVVASYRFGAQTGGDDQTLGDSRVESAARTDFPVYGSGSFSVDGRSGPDRPTVTHE
jgi:hypothetical protein